MLRQGDREAGIAHLQEALQACTQRFNAWEEVCTHLGLALAYSNVDRARSRHHLERCLAVSERRPYAMVFRRQWDLTAHGSRDRGPVPRRGRPHPQ